MNGTIQKEKEEKWNMENKKKDEKRKVGLGNKSVYIWSVLRVGYHRMSLL